MTNFNLERILKSVKRFSDKNNGVVFHGKTHKSTNMTEDETRQLGEDFRFAMRQLAATVSVITTQDGANRRGLTATAVCSLSITPPSMLVCVNQSGCAHQAIISAGCFCVNVLADTQVEIAMRFAGQLGNSSEDKFSLYRWTRLTTGAPVLDGAAANLDCVLASISQTTSHSVFIGHVKSIRYNATMSPLLHYDRRFFSLENGEIL